jgi:RNA polymerase sigma factor (sigma-70 family)
MPERSQEWWNGLLAALERDLTKGQGSRDSKAWSTLDQEVRAIALPIFRRYHGNPDLDADDLVQEVLLRLQSVKVLRRVRAARTAEGYIAVVMQNILRDHFRRAQFYERWRAAAQEVPGTEPASREELITLRETIARLEPHERRLLQLRFWDGLSIAEISERLGEKYSTISVRLFRLIQRVGAQMSR